MATVKVKLRPSTVPGKAGTIYYQLTHLRQVKPVSYTHLDVYKRQVLHYFFIVTEICVA